MHFCTWVPRRYRPQDLRAQQPTHQAPAAVQACAGAEVHPGAALAPHATSGDGLCLDGVRIEAPSDLVGGCTVMMTGGTDVGGGSGKQAGELLPAWWSEWLSDQG